MSLENRNNVNHSYNLRSTGNVINIQGRKCSFCGCDDHFITNCNNIVIVYFEKLCMLKKKELEEQGQSVILGLATWLYMYSIENTSRMVQVLAITRCRVTTRTHMGIYFNKVLQYILNSTNEDMINNQMIIEQFSEEDIVELFIRHSSLISLHLMPILVAFHGYKNIQIDKKEKINIILSNDSNNDNYEECVICYDTKQKSEFVTMNCNHEFCGTCIKNVLKKEIFKEESNCALCRQEITTIKCRTNKCLDYLRQVFDIFNN